MDGTILISHDDSYSRNMCKDRSCVREWIGRSTKKEIFKKNSYSIAGLVLAANTINIGADIAAMRASVRLLVPQLPVFITTLSFVLFVVGLEIVIPYQNI
jgi:hypothetical protein